MGNRTQRRPAAARLVCDFFDTAFDVLESWKPDLAGDLAAVPDATRLTSARLDELVRPYAAQTLSETRIPVYGAGFIAAIGLLRDARGHLSWWQGPDREQLSLAWSIINKEHLDYSEFEWYRVPMMTGKAHLSGPSVDYLCSDEYTMTIATPVSIRGRFVGVAALDLLVDSVERHLVPRLRQEIDDRATLINSADRIIVSTDPNLAAGDPVSRAGADAAVRHSCGSLALLIG
ncbi:cache domain-containing protein [Microlunatus sp. GCM10028923]|uniref:cache domain-containing protein n=1 Tax=Microlunatus sp. GCM10028923 TaxID=3273400 RepID=UPI00361B74EE